MANIELNLVGRTIVEIRPMTKAEQNAEGWYKGATVIVLDDGTKLYPSRDGEGNDAGVLFGTTKDGKAFGM